MASPGRCSSLWSVTRFLAGIVPSKPSTQHSQPTLVTEAGGQRRCLGQGGGLSPRLCLQDLCIYGRVCVYTSAVGEVQGLPTCGCLHLFQFPLLRILPRLNILLY